MFAISKNEPLSVGEPRSLSNSGYSQPLQAAPSQKGAAGLEHDREQSEFQVLLSYALQALARREHSTVELRRKLSLKAGVHSTAKTDEHIGQVVDALLLDGSLSEERFTAEFVRGRIRKGYGPIRIRMDLLERGVPDRLAEDELTRPSEFWQQQAAEVCMRKFGDASKSDNDDDNDDDGEQGGAKNLQDASPEEVREAMRDRKEASQRRWNRCARFLSQRGFPADLIYRTLDGRLYGPSL